MLRCDTPQRSGDLLFFWFDVHAAEAHLPDSVLPFFIMSGCFFIIAMHFLSFIMALSDIDSHFFIIFVSLFDIAAFAAPETPARAKLNTTAVNVLMEDPPNWIACTIDQCAGKGRRRG
jgi:hypothetical protein